MVKLRFIRVPGFQRGTFRERTTMFIPVSFAAMVMIVWALAEKQTIDAIRCAIRKTLTQVIIPCTMNLIFILFTILVYAISYKLLKSVFPGLIE